MTTNPKRKAAAFEGVRLTGRGAIPTLEVRLREAGWSAVWGASKNEGTAIAMVSHAPASSGGLETTSLCPVSLCQYVKSWDLKQGSPYFGLVINPCKVGIHSLFLHASLV